MKRSKKLQERKEARVKVFEYFEKAKKIFPRSKKQANEYVRKARNLAMKYRMKLPRDIQRTFCKHCYAYLVPGKNVTVRTREGKVVYSCKECKKFMRFPYK